MRKMSPQTPSPSPPLGAACMNWLRCINPILTEMPLHACGRRAPVQNHEERSQSLQQPFCSWDIGVRIAPDARVSGASLPAQNVQDHRERERDSQNLISYRWVHKSHNLGSLEKQEKLQHTSYNLGTPLPISLRWLECVDDEFSALA